MPAAAPGGVATIALLALAVAGCGGVTPSSKDLTAAVRASTTRPATSSSTTIAPTTTTTSARTTTTAAGRPGTATVATTDAPPPPATARTSTVDTGSIAAVFAPIAGYQWALLPAAVLDQVRQQYQPQSAGNSRSAVVDLDGRLVEDQQAPVAIVLALSFDPAAADAPGFQDDYTSSVASRNPSPVSVGGGSARSFQQDDGTKGVVYAEGRLGLIVVGVGGGADLVDITAKVVANNR